MQNNHNITAATIIEQYLIQIEQAKNRQQISKAIDNFIVCASRLAEEEFILSQWQRFALIFRQHVADLLAEKDKQLLV